jgi:5-methylcytosine-specific restriction endonuclease McrA
MPYKLEIEHLVPKASGGETIEENLWLACRE